MLSQICQNFFQGIQDDIPRVKLMKYRFFLSIDKTYAQTIMPKMLKIAIDHQLIGQYQMIHEITKTPISGNDKQYKKLREIMSSTTIKLINQSSNLQQVNNTQNLGPCYKNIADTYFKFAQYKDASSYYKKLFRLPDRTMKDQQFFTKMALTSYYLDDYGQLSMFMKVQIQKNIKRNMIDYCIIVGLKTIQINPQTDVIFQNIIQYDVSIQQIMQNKVISFSDIGFIYSLLLVAYQSRQKMCQDVIWSNKLENIYLRKNYRKLLDIVHQQKKRRCYNSLFHKIYTKCQQQIRQRVLLQVVSCYDRCPYDTLKKLTGITQGQVLLIIKNNHYIPLLNDPVSQSFVYQRKSFQLHRQVMKLHSYLGSKYQQEVKKALRLMQDQDMQLGGIGGLGKRRSGGGLGMGGRRHM